MTEKEAVYTADNLAEWPPELKVRAFGAFLDEMPKNGELFKVLSEKIVTSVNEHPVLGCFGDVVKIWLPIREPHVRYPDRYTITGSNSVSLEATPEATAAKVKKRFGLEKIPLHMPAVPILGFRNIREPDNDGEGAGVESTLVFPLCLPRDVGDKGNEFPHPEYWFGPEAVPSLIMGPQRLLRHHWKMLPRIFSWGYRFYGNIDPR